MEPVKTTAFPEIDGEIRADELSRQLFSTDASIYQVHPEIVFFPKTPDDLQTIVSWAQRENVPLTPRGGGTSLSGQSIGPGAVVDCSRFLREIRWTDSSHDTVLVQPGVVLDHLNRFLGKAGQQFGPDVAPSSRANLGGMIGNNSAGAHSIRYGHTSEHVASLSCILSNGDRVTFEPISRDEADERARGNDLEARLYREIPALIENHAQTIRERYPDTIRNSSGYGLDRFLDRLQAGVVDFTQLICGSEGTLAFVTDAELDAVSAPENKALLVYHAEDVLEAMEVNQALVNQRDPYAVELLDDQLLDLARNSLQTSRMMDWVKGEPEALLIVEHAVFPGDPSVEEQLEKTRTFLNNQGFSGECVEARTEDEQEKVWKIRKAGLPLLLGLPGNRKPTTFVEDTTVNPDRLAEYVEEFQQLVEDHGTSAAFYGHASVGCLHIRPLVNLKTAEGIENMRNLAKDAFDLVLDYHGAISGEHGVGRARSQWLETMYGTEIVELFGKIKRLFDPENLFNPGNVVDPQPMTDNLRFGPDYRAESFDPAGDFSREHGFESLVELCNGNGACRKEESGTMCPSYMVTREEKDSTRGRANALRGLISGDLDPEVLTDGTMEDVMDLCISCKGCLSECPTGVDMAPMKEEVLHKIHQEEGASLRDRFFSRIGPAMRKLEPFAPIVNLFQNVPGTRALTKRLLQIAPERMLPGIAPDPFPFDRYPDDPAGLDDPVLLYVDSFTGYIEPEIARSAADCLQQLGFDVVAPRFPCCGRPMMSKGFLDQARNQINQNLEKMMPFIEEQIPVIGLEPSCVSVWTEDIHRFAPTDRAEPVAESVQLFSDFLAEWPAGRLETLAPVEEKIVIHGHCHQKALYGTTAPEQLFQKLGAPRVRVLDSGCCGMAGSFGFEKEHLEHSRAMGERVLLPEARGLDSDERLLASGTSCRQQVKGFTSTEPLHPASYLARQIR